jgi:cardiolipin synthase
LLLISSMSWKSETVFHQGETFYQALFEEIAKAQFYIEIETYILEVGGLTKALFELLTAAVGRGVRVRLMVDGVGSWLWVATLSGLPAGVEVRCYHPLRRFGLLNRRNHKKVVLIDRHTAYLGSMNLTDAVYQWRECGVRLTGGEIYKVFLAFEKVWRKSIKVTANAGAAIPARQQLRSRLFRSESLIFNHSVRLRLRSQRQWLQLLRGAKARVWIATPYFIPTSRQRALIQNLVERGVDVRILIPNQSDQPWMLPLTFFLLRRLIRAGTKVYEFMPKILHSKLVLFDDEVLIGSTNWNHRSWLWDLEIDARLSRPHAVKEVETQFLQDLASSRQVQPPPFGLRLFLALLFARILWLFRRFL